MVDPRIVVIMECHEKLTELLPLLKADMPVVHELVAQAIYALNGVPAPEVTADELVNSIARHQNIAQVEWKLYTIVWFILSSEWPCY